MRHLSRAFALLAIALASGCDGSKDEVDPPYPSALRDINPEPGIVEVELVASQTAEELVPGKLTAMWGYRDGSIEDSRATVPGPMLEARQGDLVVVHFRNELPEPTTIHWHGLRLEARYDGTPGTQTTVPRGGEFEYRFVAQDAGFFWFHPHLNAEVQIEHGLYAPLVIRSHDGIEVDQERIFILDDVKMDGDGQLSRTTTSIDMMMGRMGNVLLVNGKRDTELRIGPHARERWRFVNAANGRFFNLVLPGHVFDVIGFDGGLLEQPYRTESLLIAPGERYEVLVTLDGAIGARIPLQTIHYERGHELPDDGPQDLLHVTIAPEIALGLVDLPVDMRTIEPIATDEHTRVRRFVLGEDHGGPDRDPSFFINGERWPQVTPTYATRGATEIWEIENDAIMDHPFHLHGAFFQLLPVGDEPAPRMAWKDTVLVPQRSTVRFAVNLEALGTWMYHCHILEHAERGMMGHLIVVDGEAPQVDFPGDGVGPGGAHDGH